MRTDRVTIGQIMIAVALAAVAFATARAPAAVTLAALLIASVGIAAWARAPWPRVAAWTFACYPLILLACLYATWGVAWCSLGHPPRSSLDDPRMIGPRVATPFIATSVLLLGCPPALGIQALLAAVEFVRVLHDDRDDLRRFAFKVGGPLLSWPCSYFWLLAADPGGVFSWFMD